MVYLPRRLRDANYKVLRPVRPNAGVAAAYRKAIVGLLKQMHDEVNSVLKAEYADNPPLAQDATPAQVLQVAIRRLTTRWLNNFDILAERLAAYFSKDVSERSDVALQRALRQAGFTVNFVITPAMRDVLEATVHENVSLIKSIPQRYLRDVEGIMMRSVQTGRDLSTVATQLQERYGVERRRAALIARDQNNKATGALTRVRQLEMGIAEAIWKHSHAGKVPRPSHVKMDGKRYDVNRGMWDRDEGRYVLPGELINCRCTSQSVIPGL